MRICLLLALFCFVVCTKNAEAQVSAGATASAPRARTATAPTPVDKKDRCRLEGVVVNALTGEPLRKATVTARGANSGGGPPQMMTMPDGSMMPGAQEGPATAVTGQDGKFVLEDVVPGRYTLVASRTGFVNGQWGARSPGKSGSPITLTTGQRLSDLTIKVTPQGVVTGRILDEDGDPMQGVQVQAIRFVYSQGRRVASPTNNVNTNDLGEYRLANLPPGRVFVMAGRQSFGPRNGKVKEAYPVVFYPNAPDVTAAAPIEITPGADMRGVDLRLRKVKAFRVTGRVAGMPAGQRSNVSLMPRDRQQTGLMMFGFNNAQLAPDGTFEIAGVLPGAYEARVNVRGGPGGPGGPGQGGPMLFARQNVDVSNEDLEGLTLTLGPGLQITGVVRVENGELPAGSRVQVRLNSRDGQNQNNNGIKADGTFEMRGMNPGAYDVGLTNLPDGHYLKAIRAGDREVGADGIDLGNAASVAFDFLIAPGAGVVTGTAQGKDGKAAVGISVSIHPKDQALARSDREKSTLTDQNGTFTFNGMAPGEYVVFAWDDAENGAWLHPDFRKPFESDATTVKLSEKGRETIQTKSIGTEKP